MLSGFFSEGERRWIALLRRPRELAERLRALRETPAGAPGVVPEVFEAEAMDEDALRQ